MTTLLRDIAHTFAAGVAIALDVALLRDARLDGPVVLVGVQAGNGDDARRRLISGDGSRTPAATPAVSGRDSGCPPHMSCYVCMTRIEEGLAYDLASVGDSSGNFEDPYNPRS